MHAVLPAGSCTQLENELEMAAFEEAAAAALDAEEKAEARRLEDPALMQRHEEHTAPSAADFSPEETPLPSRYAITSPPHTVDFVETYKPDQYGDDFNSLLNQIIRIHTCLYYPGQADPQLKLAQLFNTLGFPTTQLFKEYTVNQLLHFVYSIHTNPTTQIQEIQIRDLTTDETAQFINDIQKMHIANEQARLIAAEQAKTMAATQTNLLLSFQTTQEFLNLHQKHLLANEQALLAQALQMSLVPAASAPVPPEHAASQS